MTNQNTALALVPPGFSLVPTSFDDAIKIAEYLAKSELVPKDYINKPSNIVVAIAWGQEIGLAPLQALQNIAVINGRGVIWGDAALALCMSKPDFEDIHEEITGTGDDRVAVCTVKRKGRTPVTRSFSVQDAIQAGLWQTKPEVERKGQNGNYTVKNDSPWYKYQPRMLQMRARGFGLRDMFPDAMRGLYLAEELDDGKTEKEINPAGAPAATPIRPTIVQPVDSRITDNDNVVDAEFDESQNVGQQTGEPQIIKPLVDDLPPNTDNSSSTDLPPAIEGAATVSEGQLKVIRAALTRGSITEQVLADAMGLPAITAIPAANANHALSWIKEYAAK